MGTNSARTHMCVDARQTPVFDVTAGSRGREARLADIYPHMYTEACRDLRDLSRPFAAPLRCTSTSAAIRLRAAQRLHIRMPASGHPHVVPMIWWAPGVRTELLDGQTCCARGPVLRRQGTQVCGVSSEAPRRRGAFDLWAGVGQQHGGVMAHTASLGFCSAILRLTHVHPRGKRPDPWAPAVFPVLGCWCTVGGVRVKEVKRRIRA